MSTSHDPQFGSHPSAPAHGGHGAPAQIVWQDTSPGATPAWTGPAAFGAESENAPAEAPAHEEPKSLSSAWASWSRTQEPAASDAPARHDSFTNDRDDRRDDVRVDEPVAQQPVEDFASQEQVAQVEPDSDSEDPREAQAPVDEPNVPQTSHDQHEHHVPDEQSSGLSLSKDESHRDEPNDFGAPADGQATMHHRPDDDDFGGEDRRGQDDGSQGGYDPYARPAQQPEPFGGHDDRAPGEVHRPPMDGPQAQPFQQDASHPAQGQPQGHQQGYQQGYQQGQGQAEAQDAWSAHHQGLAAESPMATDPSAGDAIPAPPANDAPGQSGGGSTATDSDDDALTIGRGRDNSIVLDDMLVSRKHLRITADDEGLLLEDLGSRNGTYVNGRRVERSHLQEGDRIGVGGTTFEVRDGWLVTI
ncbi:FHA domain-containing protein [Yimella sp. RIT 621]|uniref:FHA domain-containing protein n=1 Tax=Yimella sp. RIT 621 TaxID=2510323 RepID=UPI00101DA95A|nr:FHA domain-containing protein [Yimella sp. RIT 621]RYG75970.1 FHA domain-containing protein [Yimella sp. RIT 621]